MFRKEYTSAKVAVVAAMGSGSSKKQPVVKTDTPSTQQTKPATDKQPQETKDKGKLKDVAKKKVGVMIRGRHVPHWEQLDMDQLSKRFEDLNKCWYDLVDELVDKKQPKVVPNVKRTGWVTVRLFISSTFKDMHSEREHLVKHTIPVLRQWCEQRKIRLIECDLRWGVPKDADTRETLMTCLSEIDRCRQENEHPYFLSMLSERYGYVMDPGDVPADIKARYKWFPGMSVTCLEIMTGAYWDNNPNALYMFRKPGFVQRLDEDLKPAYVESEMDAIESLDILKKKVKSRFPAQAVEYDCTVDGREDGSKRMEIGSLDKFGEVILEHFKVKIAQQYPEISIEQQMTETEMKRAEQEEFMLQRSQVLLGRDREVREIDDYINSDKESANVLALVGFPGAGKSSLMAYAAREHSHNSAFKVFFHFVGATPDSTSVYSILTRIYRECMPGDQQDSMPLDEEDMMRFTPTMFQEAAEESKREKHTKLLVFIDALNQLDDAHNLAWLPRQLPAGVRVIVSTLEGECLDALREHAVTPQEICVNPLDESVRKCIIDEILLTYNKRLDSEQTAILVGKADAGRPLYLSMACEELRVFGEFRRLTDKIRELSDELAGLVELVLGRVVEEFGGDLVKATLCLIETSHFGLEEEELLHLLTAQPVLATGVKDCSPTDFMDKLPMAAWGFLYVGLRSFLRPSGSAGEGRVDFYHRTISKVVRKMFLSEQTEAVKWHGRLAMYFQGSGSISRKAEELPYHYTELGDLEGLKQCLLEREMFEYLYTDSNKRMLMTHWEVAGGYQLAAQSYQAALQDYITKYKLEDSAEGEQLATKVAWFMVDIGEYDTASKLLDSMVGKLKAKYGPEAVELADPLHANMQLLMQKALKYVYGSHPGYKECCRKARELVPLTVKVHRKKFPAASNKLGAVLSLCGYFESSLLDECRTIFDKNNNKVGLAVVLYTMGEKEQYNQTMSVPISLFNQSLALCKVYFGMYHLNTARCLQLYGQLYWNRWMYAQTHSDWLDEALKLYSNELDILQTVLGHNHPTTVRSREDVIIILQNLGRNDEANELLAQQPETREGIA